VLIDRTVCSEMVVHSYVQITLLFCTSMSELTTLNYLPAFTTVTF